MNEILKKILQDEGKCEALADTVIFQITSDDEDPVKVGTHLIKSYIEGDVDGMLMALCGWSMKSLLAIAGVIPDTEDVILGREE